LLWAKDLGEANIVNVSTTATQNVVKRIPRCICMCNLLQDRDQPFQAA
jgi:hypothetical protein